MTRICLIPRVSGVGGMVSFRDKFAAGLRSRGIEVCHDLDNSPYDAVLVIGGTRDLLGLWRVKRRGVRIIQRLDGMNWVHYVRRTGLRHFFRAEFGNWLLAYIRSHLVDGVIYQSSFAHRWWERVRGPTRVPNSVVYNGVDLEKYTSQGAHQRPDDRYRILLVEGSLMGGYEMGLENAVKLVEYLNNQHSHELDRPVELMVVGKALPLPPLFGPVWFRPSASPRSTAPRICSTQRMSTPLVRTLWWKPWLVVYRCCPLTQAPFRKW